LAKKKIILIPTYNECKNIVALIKEIFAKVSDTQILVIDDNSPDGTYDLVCNLANEDERVHVIKRDKKSGLASAYKDGFCWAIENGFEYFVTMDADFSHNPDYLPEMFLKLENNDVVVGSRYVQNGGVKNWSLLRKFVSKCGSMYSKFVLQNIPVNDLTGGFNGYSLKALQNIDLSSLVAKGFFFQIEMKYKAWKKNCSIAEIPIVFEDRKFGKSKMDFKIFVEALVAIWKIRSK